VPTIPTKGEYMTISDIIDGLEEIQNDKHIISDKDVPRLCELTIELAKHVHKLEDDIERSRQWNGLSQ
jgi:hypothetical protein